MEEHAQDWTWEICLKNSYLAPKEDSTPKYSAGEFSYYGALNLSLITSQFLPYIKLFQYDSSTNLLVLFVDKHIQSDDIMETLGRAVSSDSDDPYVILNDVLTQPTSAFSIRRLVDGDFVVDQFEDLTDLTDDFDYQHLYQDLVDTDINADNSLILSYSVGKQHTFITELDVDDDDVHVLDCRRGIPIVSSGFSTGETLDTHELAYRLSDLNVDTPREFRIKEYHDIMDSVQAYIDTPDTMKNGEFAGFRNVKSAMQKKAVNRKKSKAARKAKAKKRRK